MKASSLLRGVLLVSVLLALTGSAGVGLAQEVQDEAEPAGDVSIAGIVNSKFSYQGVLEEDGKRVTGTRDMIFRLYSDGGCSAQVGSDIVKSGIQVSDGLFSVHLPVTHGHFNGQALWLKVAVGGVGIGCQEILPAPYALSLRPGATISNGDVSSKLVTTELVSITPPRAVTVGVKGVAEWGVYGYSTDNMGVYGISKGANGIGVEGFAESTTGPAVGVYGKAQSPDGTAGKFENAAASGSTYGVYGSVASPNGYGGYFVNTATSASAYGVVAYSDSSSGIAVNGYARAGSGTTRGVKGMVNSTTGAGVEGFGGLVGVYGSTSVTGGAGVQGNSNSLSAGHGVGAFTRAPGLAGAALCAEAYYTVNGIAIYGKASGNDSTMVLEQDYDDGDFIRAFQTDPSNLRFAVDVYGNVDADGAYSSPASDFAEMFPGVAGLEPGDVLVIGPDGKLARSAEANAGMIVGVHSTNPAFVGGSDDDGDNADKVPLAVVGVVPVKASAENGAIVPGDLLVASATPGHAMKADPDPPVGVVIGKALQGLAEGVGVISMLVTLQ